MSTRRCRASPGASRGRRTGCRACSIPSARAAAGAQSDVRRSGARPAAISGELGPAAADQDPGRRGAQARLDRQARGLLRTRLGLPAAGGYDDAAGPGGLGLSGGARPRQSRRHRRPGDDRLAEPRLALLCSADRDQHGARLPAAANPRVRPLCGGRFRRGRNLSVRSRPAGRQHAGDRRLARDQDADDGGADAQRQGQPLLERAARAGQIADREEGKEQGVSYFRNFHYEVLSDWGANAQPGRSQVDQLEGDRVHQEAADLPRPPAAGAVEFDGRNEV